MSDTKTIENFAKWFAITEDELRKTMLKLMLKARNEGEKVDETINSVTFALLDFALKSQIISGLPIEVLRALCDKSIDQLTTKDPDVLGYFRAIEKERQ
jgi:hypothetical protein